MTTFLISAFLFSEHPEHPSAHPTAKKEPHLTIAELAISIENYIQNDINLLIHQINQNQYI